MGNVIARALAGVELLGVAQDVAEPPLQLGPAGRHIGLVQGDGEQVGNGAALHNEEPVHEYLAECQFGIEK